MATGGTPLHRRGMKHCRRHKCPCCGQLFWPDSRNAHHQKYCSQPACRQASRQASQHRWLSQPANRDYHRGKAAVERVRAWRKAHPRYGRGQGGSLQDLCPEQAPVPQQVAGELKSEISVQAAPLQDLCLAQDPLFVGLMAHLTGALQEDIAHQIRRFQTHGQMILGKGPGIAV